MGSDVSSGDLRGFLLQFPVTIDNLWTAESSFTQAGNVAGVPEAQGSYGLGVSLSGTQTEKITITTQQGGSAEEGKFVWSGATGNAYGRDQVNLATYWEHIETRTGADFSKALHSCAGTDGNAYALVRYFDGANYGVRVLVRNTVGGYVATNLYTDGAATTIDKIHGCLLELGDGSILAIHHVINTGNTLANLQVHRSTDSGASWSLISSRALDDDLDISGTFGGGNLGYDLQKIRAAESNGVIMLIFALRAHDTTQSSTDVIKQCVSTDYGTTFKSVAITDGSVAYGFPELLSKDGNFYLFFVETPDSGKVLILPSAITSIDTAKSLITAGLITIVNSVDIGVLHANKYFDQGQITAWNDPSGKLFAIFQNVAGSANNRLLIFASADSANTWTSLGRNDPNATTITDKVCWTQDTGTQSLTNITACAHGGKALVFHNTSAATATYNNSLNVLHLGGYSSVTYPPKNQNPKYNERGLWLNTWQAFDLPSNLTEWTVGSSGGATQTLGAGKVTLNNGGGSDNVFYSSSAALHSINSIQSGMILRTRLKPMVGGSLTSDHRGINMIISDNVANRYVVQIFIDMTGIKVWDPGAGAELGSSTFASGSSIEIFASLTEGKCTAFFRIDGLVEKQWSQICNGATVALQGAGTPMNTRIFWGHITASTSTQTEWREFNFSVGNTYTGIQMPNFTNPADLMAMPYPVRGRHVYIGAGAYMTSYDGPARENESYVAEPDYDYSIRNILVNNSPSPKVTWRSTSSGPLIAPTIAFAFDKAMVNTAPIPATEKTSLGNELIGVHLSGINFYTFRILGYDPTAGAWVDLAGTVNNGFTFNFTREGRTVKASASPANVEYFTIDECAGWTMQMGSTFRKIGSNSEGTIDYASPAATKYAEFMLDDHSSADPTSGTATLIPPAATVLIDTGSVNYTGLQVQIMGQNTAEGYYQIGTLVFGRVVVFGKQYSRGREINFKPGVEVMSQQDGTQRTRRTGDGHRTVNIQWSEGVDTSPLYDSTPSPDYLTARTIGAAGPVSVVPDVPDLMMGIYQLLNGAENPIVYLPSIPRQSGNVWLFNKRSNHMICSLQDDITITNVLGDELTGNTKGEVFRVSTVTAREIV